MKIMKGKKAFLWKTVAALVILALCAGPMLASSPTYANDKDSSADSKASSAGSKATAGTVHNSFTVTISPATATAGVPTAFTLTFTNVSTTGYQQGVFQTHVPDGFTDVGTPSVVAPSPLNWFVNLADSIITAWADKGKDKLNSGQSLLVSFTATPPPNSGPWRQPCSHTEPHA